MSSTRDEELIAAGRPPLCKHCGRQPRRPKHRCPHGKTCATNTMPGSVLHAKACPLCAMHAPFSPAGIHTETGRFLITKPHIKEVRRETESSGPLQNDVWDTRTRENSFWCEQCKHWIRISRLIPREVHERTHAIPTDNFG